MQHSLPSIMILYPTFQNFLKLLSAQLPLILKDAEKDSTNQNYNWKQTELSMSGHTHNHIWWHMITYDDIMLSLLKLLLWPCRVRFAWKCVAGCS